MQRQRRQFLILAAIGGDFAALAKENEIVHAVPMLDDVQILLDLAPQRQEAQVIAPGVMNVGFNPLNALALFSVNGLIKPCSSSSKSNRSRVKEDEGMNRSEVTHKGKRYFRGTDGNWYSHLGERKPELDEVLDGELRKIEDANLWIGVEESSVLIFDPATTQATGSTVTLWSMNENQFVEQERSVARSQIKKVAEEDRLPVKGIPDHRPLSYGNYR
jgi:hypothetical protein